MKTPITFACSLFCLSLSASANASSIERLVSPTSLGQPIMSLNKTYKLGLKKQGDAYVGGKKSGFYYAGKRGKCRLELMTIKQKKS